MFVCSEVIQLSTSMTPAAAADHEDPHDTETVERTVIGESDTNFQTEFEDTEVVGKQTEISPKEPDVSIVKVEEEASDTSNTQRLESDDRTTNPNEDSEVSSNQDSHSSTIAATDKDEDKPSDTDSRQSQSSSTPKTVQQRLKENAGVNSQVAVSEEKTDSLYPLRTHFIQVKDSKDETAISGD